MSFAIVAVIGAAAGLAKVGIGLSKKKKLKEKLKKAKGKQKEAFNQYANREITNPYENLENTYEDLQVNTQQAEFEAKQNQQAQADIMGNLQGAAGSSGIAGLAQAMANKSTQDAARASASIGAQEASNERAKAGGAASVQSQKAAGESQKLQMELGRDQNILQYRAGQTAGKQQAVSDNNQMIMSGIGDVAGAGMQFAGGMPMKRKPKGKKVKRNKKK